MIFDMHNDFPTAVGSAGYGGCLAMQKDVTATAVIWTSEIDAERVESITRALERLDAPPPVAIEDLGFAADTYSTFDFSRYFYCSLTWNADNRFAGGALGSGTLTDFGKKAIRQMNGRCALDLAHLNKKSFFAALDVAQRPMCSHTGFNDHPRSLDGEQIRSLISRRGIIGLCAVTAFTGARTVGELAAVIDRFVQRYGDDCLCLGTDFYGTSDLPDGFTSYADADRLFCELNKLGYTERATDKIFYINAKRFYEETINERHL